jgi:putative ABC transport system permease protein
VTTFALKGMLGRKLRTILTAFAIVLGVATVSGTYVLTDSIDKAFDTIFTEARQGSDAVITGKSAFDLTSDSGVKAPSFDESLLDKVRGLPDVVEAEGSVDGIAQLIGRDDKAIVYGGSPNLGFSIARGDSPFNPLTLTKGAWPGENEVVIDESTAGKENFDIGQTIGVQANGPVQRLRISGLVRFGSVSTIGGATLAGFSLATAQKLFGEEGKLDAIAVSTRPGVSDQQLLEQIRTVLPPDTQVRSATAQAEEDAEETNEFISFLQKFLLAFGGVALFVGSFVIANSLSITIAQRTRELATLRTLGASRRQVLRTIVIEALVIGTIASIVGLFLGLALAVGLMKLLDAFGIELPSGGIVFSLRTIVVSLCVGTLIALLASLRPALRATRIAPIAAVREGAVLPTSRFARFALPTAAVVGVVAIALFSYGVFADDVEIKTRLFSLVAGVLLLFACVAMVASRVVRPLAYVLGAPGARFGGAAGRLARRNAVRNPARTASTAAAVMIGLALITFVAVVGQGFRSSFSSAVDKLFVADYALTAGNDALTNKAAEAVRDTPGVEEVSEIRGAEAKLNGDSVDVNGVDENLAEVMPMTWVSGSNRTPAELGRDGAFTGDRYAKDNSLSVGQLLVIRTPTGRTLRLHLEGIWDEPKGGSPFGGIIMSKETFDRAFADHDNEFTFVNMQGGPTPENTAKLDQTLAAFPNAEVETRDEFKNSQLGELDLTLNILYALLGLSVLVSLFGVVNTLVLSVFERTRELGMLRAVGMSRRQVRRMIRYESVVTLLIGASLGIAVGIFLAGLTSLALSDYGVVFALPFGSLAIFVVVAILAGMLSAILPARRASRLNVLEALQYE